MKAEGKKKAKDSILDIPKIEPLLPYEYELFKKFLILG
jgi:hypothetical protein